MVDQHNHRVQKLTRDGEYISQWGGLGDGEGQLNMPWGIDIDSNDDVYVADWPQRPHPEVHGGRRVHIAARRERPGGGQVQPPGRRGGRLGGLRVRGRLGERARPAIRSGRAVPGPVARAGDADQVDGGLLRVRTKTSGTRGAIANMYPDLPDHLNDPYRASSQTEPFLLGAGQHPRGRSGPALRDGVQAPPASRSSSAADSDGNADTLRISAPILVGAGIAYIGSRCTGKPPCVT